ncbi:MAG: TraR/DksA family transcriptional regulator [Cellulomonadaceae bacterium]
MAIQDDAAQPTVTERFPRIGRDARHFLVRDGEDPWTAKEVRSLAEELLAETTRLQRELAGANDELEELQRNFGDGAGDDQADSGSSALEREHTLTLVNNVRDLLDQTVLATQRIASGTFGTCEGCHGPVGKARLQAFPRANMCVDCKQRQERR